MIAINHIAPQKIQAIAKEHSDNIIPIVKAKIEFARLYALALQTKSNRSVRTQIYNKKSTLHVNTKNALLKKILLNKKVTKDNHSKKYATPYYRIHGNGSTPNASTHLQEFINICTWFENNLEEIIEAAPKRLLALHQDCQTHHLDAYNNLTKKAIIQYFFQYDNKLPSKDGYNGWNNARIISALESKTCYYCNRQYTFAVVRDADQKKHFMPQLDHFFDKKKNPILALSFYNLIPSCSNCNHKKSNISFDLTHHIHPYIGGFEEAGLFCYEPRNLAAAQGASEDLDILIHYARSAKGNRVKNNVQVLGLDEIYNESHKDYVREMIKKKYISNDAYLNNLIATYPDAQLSFEEAYQLAFGNYFNENEFYKRPLAKLTKDIAKDIDLIDE